MLKETLFSGSLRVGKILSDQSTTIEFIVSQNVQDGNSGRFFDERVCIMSGGDGEQVRARALAFAAVPDLIECLEEHCRMCNDCDWTTGNYTDGSVCPFAQCWKKVRGKR